MTELLFGLAAVAVVIWVAVWIARRRPPSSRSGGSGAGGFDNSEH